MLEQVGRVLEGLGLYALLCLISWLAGHGVCRLLRLRLETRQEAALAPVLGLMFWVLVLGTTGSIRLPIRVVAPGLWVATAGLVLLGMRDWRRKFQKASLAALFCGVVPLVTMQHQFSGGLLDSNRPLPQDGYCYLIAAQYQWQYGRNEVEECSYIHGMGIMYVPSRYISFSLLAHLSCLTTPGEVDAVGALYQAWILYVLASGVLYFWLTWPGVGWTAALTGTVLSATGGWMAIIVWANNMDHMVAMVYMPVLAALLRGWTPGDWRRWTLSGAVIASVVFTYAECVPYIVSGAAMVALPAWWRERGQWRAILRGGLACLVCGVVLLLPASKDLWEYYRSQMQNGLRRAEEYTDPTHRPGYGIVEGLREPSAYPAALWGLSGGSWGKRLRSFHQTFAAPVLCVLFVLGLARLSRQGEWGVPLLIGVLSLGVMVLLVGYEYAYAAYKLLSLMWWAWIVVLLAGIIWVIELIPRRQWQWGTTVVLMLIGVRLVSDSSRMKRELWPTAQADVPARDFREMRQLNKVVGRSRVMIAVEDYVSSYWALYHLQSSELCYARVRWCGNWGEPFLPANVRERTRSLEGIGYVLTDRQLDPESELPRGARKVWQSRTCDLWEIDETYPEAMVVFTTTDPTGKQLRHHLPPRKVNSLRKTAGEGAPELGCP